MPRPRNAMEIFRLLEKSNCRECGEKTCLAFAGAVYQGRKKLAECPRLDPETVAAFEPPPGEAPDDAETPDDSLESLRAEVAGLDLAAAARRLGADYGDGRLTLRVMGKKFSVDRQGAVFTDIHVNPWVLGPIFSYLIAGAGLTPVGEWVSFRELGDGKERYPLFRKRCEEPMKQVADVYTDLFDDIVHLFSGRQVAEQFQSDVSVVLHPLPRVPVMICYWRPEDGIGSSLNLYFDRTAERNLGSESLFTLGAGMALMFEKLARRHGAAGS